MKKLILLLPLFLLFACNNEPTEVEKPAKATISGKIENPKGTVTVSNRDEKTEAAVDVEGNFTLTFDIEKAGMYRLSHGNERTSIFVEPGDEFKVTLNTEKFDESLKYDGTGAAENNYLASKYLLDEKISIETSELYSKSEEEFLANINAQEQKMMAHYQEFAKNAKGANENFVKEQKLDIQFKYAMNKTRYESYHKYFTKNEEFALSENYYDFQKDLPMNEDILVNVSAFKNYFDNLLMKKAEEELGEDYEYNELVANALKIIPQISENQKVRDFGYYKIVKDLVSIEGTDFPNEIMESFKKNCQNEEYLTEVQEVYNNWAKLAKGETAPEFAYANIDGKTVALADLKGKYVYIDVWATWCGPCRREHPHFEELQEKYADNEQVVFAGVSIDKDKGAWEKWVEEKEMKGVQLIADKAWDSSICKDYMIKGIPRFMLIDQEGKILDANAPRPSSEEIKTILEDISKPVLTSMK